jgi:hypothetical protein
MTGLLTLVANPSPPSSSPLQSGKPRAAGRSEGRSGQPFAQADEVDGDGRDDVLQAGLGQPDVAALAQTAAADGLFVGALDAGALGVVGAKRLGRLHPAGILQRFVFLTRLQADRTRAFRFRALDAVRTRRAVFGCETRFRRDPGNRLAFVPSSVAIRGGITSPARPFCFGKALNGSANSG